ncbi:hypothetical protein HanIR_Chr07g0329731 [Helianthus annuus]|nr:hypothetical protein HanIR_Chr07g0329731 [Helianthus annuus]
MVVSGRMFLGRVALRVPNLSSPPSPLICFKKKLINNMTKMIFLNNVEMI